MREFIVFSGGGIMTEKKNRNRSYGDANKIRMAAKERVVEGLFERLEELNELLLVYVDSVKEMQPIGHGSLVPHLQVCKPEGCLGCLHIRWKRWYDPSKSQKKRQKLFGDSIKEKTVASSFRAEDLKSPLQKMPRGPEYESLRDTIKALESVRKMRENIVKHITNAARSTSRMVE